MSAIEDALAFIAANQSEALATMNSSLDDLAALGFFDAAALAQSSNDHLDTAIQRTINDAPIDFGMIASAEDEMVQGVVNLITGFVDHTNKAVDDAVDDAISWVNGVYDDMDDFFSGLTLAMYSALNTLDKSMNELWSFTTEDILKLQSDMAKAQSEQHEEEDFPSL